MPSVVAAVAGIVKGVVGVVGAVAGALSGAGVIATLGRVAAGLLVSQLLAPKQSRRALTGSARNGTFTIRQPSPSRRIPYGVSRLGGIYFYAETTGTQLEDLYLILGIGDGPIQAVDKLFFDGEEISLTSAGTDSNGKTIWKPTGGHDLEDVVRAVFYTGSAGQPADASLVAASDSLWTTSHTLDGIAYACVKLTWDAALFPQGVPNISFEVRGRNDVYDPRTASTAYTDNPALSLVHYLTTAKTGAGATYADEIDETALIAAANVCEESVSLKAGGNEERYTCNGFVDLGDNPEDVVEDFKAAMAGWMTYVGGKFKVYAGAYDTPTFTIDEDMLVGPVRLRNKAPKRDRVNTVRGVYQAEENHYQPTDFPSVTNSSYVTADGVEISADLELVFTTSPATAQRLAKIELERGRLEKTVELVCNLRAMPAEAGQTVMLDFERFGFDGKVFLVESSRIGPVGDGTVGVMLSLREFGSGVYSWTPASDEKTVATSPDLQTGPPQVADISASPSGGDFPIEEFPKVVALTTTTSGASIRWSKLSAPATETSGTEYVNDEAQKPRVYDGETLYARGFKDGYAASDPMSEEYLADFNPNDVSGLEAWWRSDVEGSLTYPDLQVTVWAPEAGGSPIWQSYGTNATLPVHSSAAGSVSFDGSDDRLRLVSGPDGTLPKTIIVAVTNPSSPSGMVACMSDATATTEVIGIFCDAGTWKARVRKGGSTQDSSGVSATASGVDVVAAVFATSGGNTTGQVRVNKSSDTVSASVADPSLDQGGLGAEIERTNVGSFANMEVHEVLIYNAALSSGDIDNITDYLTAKYG